jgi:hypothetical protein
VVYIDDQSSGWPGTGGFNWGKDQGTG